MAEENPTTRLLNEYKDLYKQDPEAADAFAEKHKDNEWFYSLAQLQKQIVPAICEQKDFILNALAAANHEDSPVKEVLIKHAKVELTERVIEKLSSEDETA